MLQNLFRLNEDVKSEADAVSHTLSFIENITEQRPALSEVVVDGGAYDWLLKRVRAKGVFNDNKLHAGEILSILLTSSEKNRVAFADKDGIEVVLRQLASFRKADPPSSQEYEYMENLFNSLCASLLLEKSRRQFLEAEGLQLMNIMLRGKKASRAGALKVIDYVLSADRRGDACKVFVEILGLRTIFPLLLKSPKQYNKRTATQQDMLESIISIVASLAKYSRGDARGRFFAKFQENSCEKIDRLLELHTMFKDRRESNEVRLRAELDDEDLEPDEFQEELYSRRVDEGLYSQQLVDITLLELDQDGRSEARAHLQFLLRLKGMTRSSIADSVQEHVNHMRPDADHHETEHARLTILLDSFLKGPSDKD